MLFSNLNLNPDVVKAVEACGYKSPTPIQEKAIPEVLLGKDIVASAKTGTGKTAAFTLPALHKLSEPRKASKPRVLILTPTRELATQITDAASLYGKFLRFNKVSLVGGMPYRQQLKGLSRPVDMIIATPGRLMDHMENRRIDLSGIEMLILDEADRMLDMGFIDDVKFIANATPKNRQTLLFSATVDDRLHAIIKQLLKEPVRIDLSEKTAAPAKIKQELYIADHVQHKTQLLEHFINDSNIYKGIIFCAMKIHVDKLADHLRDLEFSAMALHGDLKQNLRNKTIEQFRRGKVQFLVATDVAARGLDIKDVSHVINYDLPKFSEDYVHRIGRTGRAGKEGIAISFVLPNESRHVQKIERYIGERIELLTVEGLESKQGYKAGSSNKKPGGKKKKFGASKDKGKSSFKFKSYDKSKNKENSGDHKKDHNKREYKKEFKKDPSKKEFRKEFSKDSSKREFKKEFKKEFRKDFKKPFKKDGKKEQPRYY